MPGRNFLFIPGPTNVPRRIQNAMYVEQEDMRAMDLPEFTKPLYEDLKKIFKTKNGRIFIFPASGTGGWESAVSNTLNTGDKVLMSGFGHFSNFTFAFILSKRVLPIKVPKPNPDFELIILFLERI